MSLGATVGVSLGTVVGTLLGESLGDVVGESVTIPWSAEKLPSNVSRKRCQNCTSSSSLIVSGRKEDIRVAPADSDSSQKAQYQRMNFMVSSLGTQNL